MKAAEISFAGGSNKGQCGDAANECMTFYQKKIQKRTFVLLQNMQSKASGKKTY